jgi:hypothetical protein
MARITLVGVVSVVDLFDMVEFLFALRYPRTLAVHQQTRSGNSFSEGIWLQCDLPCLL